MKIKQYIRRINEQCDDSMNKGILQCDFNGIQSDVVNGKVSKLTALPLTRQQRPPPGHNWPFPHRPPPSFKHIAGCILAMLLIPYLPTPPPLLAAVTIAGCGAWRGTTRGRARADLAHRLASATAAALAAAIARRVAGADRPGAGLCRRDQLRLLGLGKGLPGSGPGPGPT